MMITRKCVPIAGHWAYKCKFMKLHKRKKKITKLLQQLSVVAGGVGGGAGGAGSPLGGCCTAQFSFTFCTLYKNHIG